VLDHGAKAISGIASLIGGDDEEAIDRVLDGIPDPVGTFYRYGLPASLLRRKTSSKKSLSQKRLEI
jgi:F420-non-reducing hydrogenase small subunit